MSETARPWKRIFLSPLPWFLLGLALRLAYLMEQQATSVLFYQPLLDEQEMARAARQLLAGGGFGHEPLFKAPLYPLYLAGVMFASGEGWFFVARLLQHLLGAGLILIAYDTARRCASGPGGRGELAGALAAGVVALYGPLIRLEDSLILDYFTVFLQSAMLWALVRLRTAARPKDEIRWAAGAGAAAALAWLNRPTLTPLLPLLALWIVGWREIGLATKARRKKAPEGLPGSHAEARLNSRDEKNKDEIMNPPAEAGGKNEPAVSRLSPSARVLNKRAFKRRLACAAVFLALPLLAMALVYWRNARAGGEGMVLPWQGGFNFYYANGADANGKYFIQEGYSLARTGNPTRELAEAGYRAGNAMDKMPGAESSLSANGSSIPHSAFHIPHSTIPPGYFHAIDHYWMTRAKEEIAADPARWLGLMGRKLLYLTTAREIFNFEVYEIHQQMSWVLRGLPLSFGVLWPLALAGAALAGPGRRGRRGLAGLLWLYGIALGGAIALYYVSGRLRMPLVFPAAVLAALGLASATTANFKSRSAATSGQGLESSTSTSTSTKKIRAEKKALLIIALFLVGCAMSWGDWWEVRSESQDHIEYARLSNAAWRAGEYARALEYATACEREHPGYPSAALLKGQALYSLGEVNKAVAAFADSLRRLPDDPVAAFNLGIIAYYDRPEPRAAAEMFMEALRRQPQYHQAAWMGALAWLRVGGPGRERAQELLRPYLPLEVKEPPRLLLTAAIALNLAEGKTEEARRLAEALERSGGPEARKTLAGELKHLDLALPGT